MNDDEQYILISTPELNALYPKQSDDEYFFEGEGVENPKWCKVGSTEDSFPDRFTRRRLRVRAWLEITKMPVQYPAWLERDGLVIWFRVENFDSKQGWNHWQPAMSAPKPPKDEDEQEFEKGYSEHAVYESQRELALTWFKAGRAYERSKASK